MRKLMWFTVGFAAGCGLCAYGVWHPEAMLPSSVILFFLFLAGRILAGERIWLRRTAAIFLGCSVGFAWFLGFRSLYLKPLDSLAGTECTIEITATDYSYETNYGMGADGILTVDGKPYQIRTYINEKADIQPGDRITGTFSLRFADRKISTYFRGNGIFLFAYQKGDIHIAKAAEIPRWYIPSVLRRQIQLLLETCIPEDVSPFSKALLLGDDRELDYALDTAFKISGIRHIIAVSGLHISILYGLVCIVTLRRRYLTAVLGMPVLLLFAAVAGFTPSVVRACIMVWLMMLAQIFDREYDPATALAFAVLVMLSVNPMAAVSVSLQMSVSCVAGILLFHMPINSWLKAKLPKKGIPAKLRGRLCGSIAVTLSAMSLVTPLSAWYFGTVSLVSVLTNVLTLWMVTLIFYGLIGVCMVCLLSPWMGAFLGTVLAWPMRYVLFAAKTLATIPLAAVYTESIYIVIWLIFIYILLGVFLLQRKKRPGILFCCSVLGLCGALLASWGEPLLDSVRITMLDVGQGQSILLQSEGRTFLVDCGGDDDTDTADIIAETLLSQGISRLDGILLTHYDRDHSGALHNLLTRIDTDLLILPDTRNGYLLPEYDAQIQWVWEDMELSFGSSCMVVYGPVYSGMDNENSLCVLFDTKKCDILITGDRTAFGERMLMRQSDLPDVDVLVAGHHGAADSTSEELLRMSAPEIVLISVKENNFYGHPSDILLRRLETFGCTVFRTDRDGTITIRR